jgi:glutathione S-transferase
MITLYIKSPCKYSEHAIAAFDAFNVPFEEKNIADPKIEAELLKIGGRHKVPFMVDGDVHLYESEEIVAYIEKHFGNGEKAPKPRVHFVGGDETCSI